MTTNQPVKEIVYDRESRDYAMYLDGELVGFARTNHEAETTLDKLVHDRLTHTITEPVSEPTMMEAAVAVALERLASENAQSARTARTAGEKDDAKFFQRAANSYSKALLYWQNGVRPQQTPNGWMLPSQRPEQPPHLLIKDGDWICSCPSSEQIHWASALIIGLEVVTESLSRLDDGFVEIEPVEADNAELAVVGAESEGAYERATAASLGQRIAAARARMLQAA